MLSKDNPETQVLDDLEKMLATAKARTSATDLAGVTQAAALISIARSLAVIAEHFDLTEDVVKIAKRPGHPEDDALGKRLAELDVGGLTVEQALAAFDPDGDDRFDDPPREAVRSGKKGKKGKGAKKFRRPAKTTRDKLYDALAELERTPGFSRTPPPPRKPNKREIDPMIKLNDPELGAD